MAVNWGEASLEVGSGERKFHIAVSGQIIAMLVALMLGFPFAAAVAASAGLPAPDFTADTAAADPGPGSPATTRPDDRGDENGQGQGGGSQQGGPDGQGTGRGNGDDPTSPTTTLGSTTSTSTSSTTVPVGPTTTVTPTTFVFPPTLTTTTMPCTCEP